MTKVDTENNLGHILVSIVQVLVDVWSFEWKTKVVYVYCQHMKVDKIPNPGAGMLMYDKSSPVECH